VWYRLQAMLRPRDLGEAEQYLELAVQRGDALARQMLDLAGREEDGRTLITC
jgi:hypothetical protein